MLLLTAAPFRIPADACPTAGEERIMKQWCFALFALLSFTAFSQEMVEAGTREAFTLNLMIDEKEYYSTRIPAAKFVVKPNEVVQLFPGDDIYISARREGKVVLLEKVYRAVDAPGKYLHLKFEQQAEGKLHRRMMLTVGNPFPFTLKYSATIYPWKGGDRWFPTSIIPVLPGIEGIEMWDDLLITISLYEFEALDE
jgi:hypothetical protein